MSERKTWRPTHIVHEGFEPELAMFEQNQHGEYGQENVLGFGFTLGDWMAYGHPSWVIDASLGWRTNDEHETPCEAELIADEVEPRIFAILHGVHRGTVDRWVARGLEHRSVGRKVLIPRDADVSSLTRTAAKPEQAIPQSKDSNFLPSKDGISIEVKFGDGTSAKAALYLDDEGYFSSSPNRTYLAERLRELCKELRHGKA